MHNHMKMTACCLAALLSGGVMILPVSAEETAEAVHIWDGTADLSWFDAEETELEIATPEALFGYAKLAGEGKLNKNQNIRLTTDLYMNDLADYDTWSETAPANVFTTISENKGIFDGCGHTIYGLYGELISKNSGTVKNLNIESCFIRTVPSKANYCGGIAGFNNGTISNCQVSGEINNTTTYIGGICGGSNGTVQYCRNAAALYGYDSKANDPFVGGVCGLLWGKGIITECSNSGNIFGYCIQNTYTSGFVAGGIVAGITDSEYEDESTVLIDKVCNSGSINIENRMYHSYYGGIVGTTETSYVTASDKCSVTIQNAYNTGDINADGYTVGGMIGYIKNAVCKNVYSTGTISTAGEKGVGSVIGIAENMKEITNAYYLNSTGVLGIASGDEDTTVSKSEANMKKDSFAETLGEAFVYRKDSYPRLLWECIGDANEDNEVTAADAALLRKYLLGQAKLTASQAACADINRNGILTSSDLTQLKRMILCAAA